ncbi:hypothetical protein XENOCAPTIV_017140, partial [Xenoophorus captivus]
TRLDAGFKLKQEFSELVMVRNWFQLQMFLSKLQLFRNTECNIRNPETGPVFSHVYTVLFIRCCTRPSLKTPDRGPPSHNRQSPEQQTEPCQPLLSRSQRPTAQRLEKAASSSAGLPWVKGGLKHWSGPVSRQLQTELVKVSNPPVSTGEEDQVQRVGKPEEAALQSCPMCLQGFPAG